MRPPVAIWLALVLPFCGCTCFDFEDQHYYQPEQRDASVPPLPDKAPWFVSVTLPDPPRLGPTDKVVVQVADDHGLDYLAHGFRDVKVYDLWGTSDEVDISAQELGEGLGTLNLMVVDLEWQWTMWSTDILVDFSPPEIDARPARLRPDQELEVWVGDAWMLGAVEITVGSLTTRHDFSTTYPPTIGTSWDTALVGFALSDVPDGEYGAEIVATDSVGNEAKATVDLEVDGTPPAVSVLAPAPGATVSGLFEVQLVAEDPGGGPVHLVLVLGGAEVAEAAGPAATVVLDAGELAPGELDLEATAWDLAGNASPTVVVPLVVAP